MEDLPGDVHVDAQVVVDHLRSLAAARGRYPRTWLPQATFDALQIRADREPIHLNLALHHLHQKWNMDDTRELPEGRGVKAALKRFALRMVNHHLQRYFVEEQDFRAALAQSIDAVAYRVDEVSTSDFRALLDLVRADLADLARHVDEQIEARLGERAGGTREGDREGRARERERGANEGGVERNEGGGNGAVSRRPGP